MHKCGHTIRKRSHLRWNIPVLVYNLYAPIYAQIFMQFETQVHEIQIDHHIKFRLSLDQAEQFLLCEAKARNYYSK